MGRGGSRWGASCRLPQPSAPPNRSPEPQASPAEQGWGTRPVVGGSETPRIATPEPPFSRASSPLTGLKARCHTSHPGAEPFLTCRGAPHPGPAGALRPPAVTPDPSVGLTLTCPPPGSRWGAEFPNLVLRGHNAKKNSWSNKFVKYCHLISQLWDGSETLSY